MFIIGWCFLLCFSPLFLPRRLSIGIDSKDGVGSLRQFMGFYIFSGEITTYNMSSTIEIIL